MVARTLTVPEWRALHGASIIGSGSAANVCGFGYSSPLQEWGERIGTIPPDDVSDLDAVWLGREMEETVLRFHEKRSGARRIQFATCEQREDVERALTAGGACEVLGWVEDRQPYVRSKRYPWMVATLDGLCAQDRRWRTVEAKYPGLRQMSKWADGTAPDAYRLQVQHTLITIGSISEGDLVALLGHDYRCVSVALADTNVDAIVALERHFVECVESSTEPRIDASASALSAFKALHPEDNGKTAILGAEAIELHKRLAQIDAAMEPHEAKLKPLEKERAEIKARLSQLIGDHTFGALPDGSATYSLKTTVRKPSAGSTFRTLRLVSKKD